MNYNEPDIPVAVEATIVTSEQEIAAPWGNLSKYAPSSAIPARQTVDHNNNSNGRKNYADNTISSTLPAFLTRDPYLNETQLKELSTLGFSKGLAETFSHSISEFALRYFIIDNSGSMRATDGERIVDSGHGNGFRAIPCTRWDELKDTVDYHVKLAAIMKAPTKFRLLNAPGPNLGPQTFSIACTSNEEKFIASDLEVAQRTMSNVKPTGLTPLITHINAIREEVQAMAPALVREGKMVSIVIATDGLPTNSPGTGGNELENFIAAMKTLEGLPVWMVIRLCTDSERIVNYYNDLDKQLEFSLEVLDNYTDEAKEMYTCNSWLNYTLQLHRMRELGFHDRILDFLDERQLSLKELQEFCIMFFGRDIPNPEFDFKQFTREIQDIVKKEGKRFHPVRSKMKSLVSVKKITHAYDGASSCMIM